MEDSTDSPSTSNPETGDLTADSQNVGQSDGSTGSRLRIRAWDVWVAILPGIAMLPLLVPHGYQVLSQPHMLFAPAVWLGVAIYSLFRLRSPECLTMQRKWTAIAMFAVGGLTYFLAVLFYSPWWAFMSAVLVFLAWALGRWGQSSWPTAGALALLLASTQIWPRSWDLRFSSRLRRWAADYASNTLDAFSVPNLVEYETIETTYNLVSLPALHGFTSVFLLIAMAIALCILFHRSAFHGWLLVLSCPLWLICGTYLFILWQTYRQTSFSSELTSAADLLTVQVVMLIFGVVSVFLADRFIAAVVRPVPVTDPDLAKIFLATNLAINWPQQWHVDAPWEQEDPDDAPLPAVEPVPVESPPVQTISWLDQPVSKWSTIGTLALILLAGVPAAIVLAKTPPWRPNNLNRITADSLQELPDEKDFDEQIGVWKKISVERTLSSDGSLWSYRCMYQWGGQRVEATLSFPHDGWPDRLKRSFKNWRVASADVITGEKVDDWSIELSRQLNPLGGQVYSCACAIDDQGVPIGTPSALQADQSGQSQQLPLLERLNPSTNDQPASYLFVATCETGDELDLKQSDEFVASFIEFRKSLRGKFQIPDTQPDAASQ